MPHIYTTDEIGRLLGAAAQLSPKASLRPATYMALFALLVSTGIRISEALALQIVDITPAGLLIRHTKFRKSRLVPFHATVGDGLDRYLLLRRQVGGDSTSLFVSNRGTGLAYSTVNHVFLGLVRSTGLRGGPGTKGPRLHDIRHTFAVRSLEACHGSKEEMARHLLALSTYLGHAHPSDTSYYLQATPRLMEAIVRRCSDERETPTDKPWASHSPGRA